MYLVLIVFFLPAFAGKKKACFRAIKTNQFLHRNRKNQTIDEVNFLAVCLFVCYVNDLVENVLS